MGTPRVRYLEGMGWKGGEKRGQGE